jgi:hypothetical protein
VAVSFVPAGMLLFFKTGPFAYHGLFPFWLPVATFGLWVVLMPWACHQAITSPSPPEAALATPQSAPRSAVG